MFHLNGEKNPKFVFWNPPPPHIQGSDVRQPEKWNKQRKAAHSMMKIDF